MYTIVFSTEKRTKTTRSFFRGPRLPSLSYAPTTFVLPYTLHSGDKALTQVIRVLRKNVSGVFIILTI